MVNQKVLNIFMLCAWLALFAIVCRLSIDVNKLKAISKQQQSLAELARELSK